LSFFQKKRQKLIKIHLYNQTFHFYTNTSDFESIRQNLNRDYRFSRYAPPTTLLKNIMGDAEKQKTIVDVGAYIGASMLFFKTLFPDSQVVGVEPDIRNFQLLNLNLGHLSNFKVFNKILSPKLYYMNKSNYPNRIKKGTTLDFWVKQFDNGEDSKIGRISGRDLIDLLETDYVDILKISCETMTSVVLDDFLSTGRVKAVAVSVRTRLMENHLGQILQILNKHGRLSLEFDCMLNGSVIWNYPVYRERV